VKYSSKMKEENENKSQSEEDKGKDKESTLSRVEQFKQELEKSKQITNTGPLEKKRRFSNNQIIGSFTVASLWLLGFAFLGNGINLFKN
jgi:hypothetical protein